VGSSAFKTYISENKKDFILYKTTILLKDAGNDPIRKAEVIREVVESIAKIPDSIKASVFIKECSSLMRIEEQVLLSELNKMRLGKAKKDQQQDRNRRPLAPEMPPEALWDDQAYAEQQQPKQEAYQEKEIVRLLLLYGNRMINWDGIANTYIGPFMVAELSDVAFDDEACKQFVGIYREELEKGILPEESFFIHHADKKLVDLAVDLLSTRYTLSANWMDMHHIAVPDEQKNMKATILGAIFHLKKHKVGQILDNLRKELQKAENEADQEILMNQYLHMKKVEKSISDYLGSVIIK
jgi:DNA primase